METKRLIYSEAIKILVKAFSLLIEGTFKMYGSGKRTYITREREEEFLEEMLYELLKRENVKIF